MKAKNKGEVVNNLNDADKKTIDEIYEEANRDKDVDKEFLKYRELSAKKRN